MNPFEAYTTYLAVKNHFERDGYDYFKYHGKVPAKLESFYARKDRYFFEKLARKEDLLEFLVANFLENDKSYSRDLTQEDAERVYRDWVKRTQSLTYRFSEELEKIEDLKQAVRVEDGQHPQLLKMYMQKKVSAETILVIDSLANIIEAWDKKIEDTVMWPTIRRKLVKYKPFLKFEKDKFREIVLEKYVRN
jgi:hypothetical protein